MTAWTAVLLAAASCYALKLAGWLLPAGMAERPRPSRIAPLLTVALLAALVAVQTAADGGALAVDARLAGLVVAIVALALRAPFLLVLAVAAATAAGLRALA